MPWMCAILKHTEPHLSHNEINWQPPWRLDASTMDLTLQICKRKVDFLQGTHSKIWLLKNLDYIGKPNSSFYLQKVKRGLTSVALAIDHVSDVLSMI